MKRCKIRLLDIAERNNLTLALYKAARSKRMRTDVAAFIEKTDCHLNQLANDILNQSLPYGDYKQFQIYDPKQREIHAASFEDRIYIGILRLMYSTPLGVRSKTGENRVVRGGSWINNGRNCRSAIRNWNEPGNRNNNVGLRLAQAQRVISIGANDQIVIRSCAARRQAKSKIFGTLVARWIPGESLPAGRVIELFA